MNPLLEEVRVFVITTENDKRLMFNAGYRFPVKSTVTGWYRFHFKGGAAIAFAAAAIDNEVYLQEMKA